jgi:tRNA splicing ligase
MISYNQNKNEIELTIPVAGIAELYNYQKGLLAILAEVEINDCDKELKENLKSVYQLLGHILLDHNFLNQHELLLNEYKDMIVKYADGKVKGLDDF